MYSLTCILQVTDQKLRSFTNMSSWLDPSDSKSDLIEAHNIGPYITYLKGTVPSNGGENPQNRKS